MSVIKQALYSFGSSIFIWSYTRHSVCCVWALMHLKQCEVNEDWRSCPVSLLVFLTVAFTVITTIMALITRCAAQAWPLSDRCKMTLCSIYNSVQSRRVRWICLFITDHAQHQSLQWLICHLYSPRQTSVGCFSPSYFPPLSPKTVCPPPTELSCVCCVCRETMVGWQPCPTWPTGSPGRRMGSNSPVRLSTRAHASPRPRSPQWMSIVSKL